MSMELPKHYDPREAQGRWLRFWNERGFFHARPDPNRRPFCIVIPPPNVTGALHLGHALNNTLQDVLIRWRRMQGYNVLWVPGTDHAGIATQTQVERALLQEGTSREEIGREAFVERVPITAPEGEPLRLEFESFLAAVQGRQPVTVTGEDGREALAVALTIVSEIERTLPSLAAGTHVAAGA